jgi:predicted DNA-binding transcriptional regulator AlpA
MSRAIPDWPRMMKRGTAALYLDLSAAEFDREVGEGRLPGPIMLGRAEHWSRVALDERLAEMVGEGKKRDWRKDQPLYAA